MARWKIISGARPFYTFAEREVAVGWARDLEKDDIQRTVNVCVSREADQASDLPDECRRAIRTHGRSVINAILTEDDLPRIVDVTLTGLEFEYGGWPSDVDEDDEEDVEDDENWDETDDDIWGSDEDEDEDADDDSDDTDSEDDDSDDEDSKD